MRGAFVFDANRCTGCQACELACSIENDLGAERSWRTVFTFNPDGLPGVPLFHLSLACNHCAEPACMHACPALAYGRDLATGAILVDPSKCIGCRYCSWACPYGAPRFEPDRGVMGKCTLCAHRLRSGAAPACASCCPTGALDFQELHPSELADRIDGMPRTRLGPAIRILRGDRRESNPGGGAPEEPAALLPMADQQLLDSHAPAPDVAGEWSLAAFTFLMTLMFAAVWAAARGALAVHPAVFAAGVLGGAGLSLSHLGRPGRAWRATLNLRRSWLSREVVAFGTFSAAGMGLATDWAWLPGAGPRIAAVAVGVAMLIAADLVYLPVYRGRSPVLDDGGALLTGLYLAGLLGSDVWLALPAGTLKLGAAIAGTGRAHGGPAPDTGPWTAARLLLGLAIPAAAWAAGGTPLGILALAAGICGEAIARARFYQRLRVVSPASQMRSDLNARLARVVGETPAFD